MNKIFPLLFFLFVQSAVAAGMWAPSNDTTHKFSTAEQACGYLITSSNPDNEFRSLMVISQTQAGCRAQPKGVNYDLGVVGQVVVVESDVCESRYQQSPRDGWFANTVGKPSLESNKYCDDGCVVAFNASPTGVSYTNGKLRLQRYSVVQLGYACTSEASTPTTAEPPPPTPEKKPPCDASEGVLTSSTGKVACVSEGTPGSAKPNVTKGREKKTFPDGSTSETETTTTTDPQTGAQDVNSKKTNTPASNGQEGQAGPPGTSSTEGNSDTKQGDKEQGDNNGKFCAENPTLQICKDGMASEKTLQKIADALKWEDPTATDKSPLEKADGEFANAAEAHEGLIRKIGEDFSASPSFFSWALLPDVPAGACNAFTGNVGGHQLSLDWCDKMGLIRELAGYCFYILTAYGLFSIFTSSTQNGGGK